LPRSATAKAAPARSTAITENNRQSRNWSGKRPGRRRPLPFDRLRPVAPLVAGAREHPTTAGYAARIRFGSGEYDTLRVPWGRFGLRLLWKDEAGLPLATLDAARAHLQRLGLHPVMLTNAGIFDTDFAPMGLHVEGGQVLRPLNLADGNGNFFLKPNGVFVVTPERFLIIPSEQFSTLREPVLTATQSGPLLLERGRIHPLFSATSNNRYVRSGVGVRGEREILFAISRNPVTLHEFALLFRDALDCDSALYLDGAISQMDLPALGLSPPPSHFAGILAVVEPLPEEHGGGI